MRATPTPGLSGLGLRALPVLLALGACTPQLDLNNRPPPCLSGQEVCPSRGTCVSHEEAADAKLCQYVTVRQGANNIIPVPGLAPSDVTVMSAPDVIALVVPSGSGSMIAVSAPHGTTPGDRLIKLSTVLNGVPVERDITLIVSQIAVRPDGDDNAAGTTDDPFKTLLHATSFPDIARAGDTIKLLNGNTSTNGVPADSPDAPPVALPAGVTIEGEDGNQLIEVRLTPLGSVTFNKVRLWQRLLITAPSSTVVLTDVMTWRGVTVSKEATGASLEISGGSEMRSDDVYIDPKDSSKSQHSDSPVEVRADDASVTLQWHATIAPTGTGPIAAVRMTGHGQTFVMSDAEAKSSTGGMRTLQLDGATRVTIQRSTITGRVEINEPTAEATIANTELFAAQTGGVLFQGANLMIAGCTLKSVPVEQFGASSVVRVRNTEFLEYGSFGYRLWNGHLDLGTADDVGGNMFTKSLDVAAGAALDIEEPTSGNNGVTVSGTSFDGQPVPGFTAMGPTPPPANSIYFIANPVSINFY